MLLLISFVAFAGARLAHADDPVGKHFEYSAQDLPKPTATRVVMNFPTREAPAGEFKLSLPPGFKAEVFAEGGFREPRNIKPAPNGDLFLVDSTANELIVLRDADKDGKAEFRETFTNNLKRPFGLAFAPGYVYVGNTNSVVRFAYEPGQTKAKGAPEVIVKELPTGGQNNHWTRNLKFSGDGKKLFVSVGSSSNVGEEAEPRACILQCNPDGSELHVYGRGLRNAVGLDINPKTNELWAAVNERDQLGDDLVPDYITSVKENGFYGWPYFYLGKNPDARMKGKGADLADKVIVPDVLVASHSAALGIAFYDGKMFPPEYQGDLFAALHGSWNRSLRTGYKIIRVKMKDGKPVGGYENFMTGWLQDPRSPEVFGRPVMVTVAPDGALLVVDDHAKKVWRVSYAAAK